MRRIEVEDCGFKESEANLATNRWLGEYRKDTKQLQDDFYRLTVSRNTPANKDFKRDLICVLLDRQELLEYLIDRKIGKDGGQEVKLSLALLTQHIIRLVDPHNMRLKKGELNE